MSSNIPRSGPLRVELGESGMQLQLQISDDGTEVDAVLFLPDTERDEDGDEIGYKMSMSHVTAAALSHALRTYSAEVALTIGKRLHHLHGIPTGDDADGVIIQ